MTAIKLLEYLSDIANVDDDFVAEEQKLSQEQEKLFRKLESKPNDKRLLRKINDTGEMLRLISSMRWQRRFFLQKLLLLRKSRSRF